ncbi:hypothetical protein BC351_10565 [Paenibacillus ferrarius]|uniref:Uncharacterized protein n=1 Tax=Paenibacillus ferrarius TaxID=1469647 RepID=A0A1V4H8Y2_9BACL|nr:hypothetical protein [Paenibacillus ferrarius]OPH47623.1 hypothetical protein BC351_10565 [Paenibacillus ferrarius]
MSNKTKKLSLTEYNKLEKQFNERKQIRITVILPEGETKEYDHSIATTFKPTDIQKLSIDYLSLLYELQNNPDVTSETFYNANSLLNALIVKYFSDVPVTIDNLESIIKVSEVLFNLGIMEQLFDESKGFSKSEIEKLSATLEKNSKVFGQQFGELVIKSGFNLTGDETVGRNELEST